MEEIRVQESALSIIDKLDLGSIDNGLKKIRQFQETVKALMVEEQDYGVIPGTQKPTLLKPGAEKLLTIMGITSTFEIIAEVENWDKGIFAYTVRCILYTSSGTKITEGLGHCNSKEDKYRYRWVKEADIPVGVVKEALKKNQYDKYRIENDEIFSQVNTMLKMAEKRAMVDAALRVGSLSNIFTQDIEDMKSFHQSEQIGTMTFEDAKKVKLNFGKYKGMLMGDLLGSDLSYLEWIEENARDPRTKQAARILLFSENPPKDEDGDAKQGSGDQPTFMDLSDKDLPF